MKPSDEFKDGLTLILNAKAANQQLAIFDGLLDTLIEMLMGLFDQCLGQLSPAQVAARMANASTSDKVRFRTRVRKGIYDGSRDYRTRGGQHVADSVFETTAAMGAARCEKLVLEMSEGENWFPGDDFLMG